MRSKLRVLWSEPGILIFAILADLTIHALNKHWRLPGVFILTIPILYTTLSVRGRIRVGRFERQIDRVRHDHCPTCGYDLRACTSQCSECGNAIPHGEGVILHEWMTRLAARKLLARLRRKSCLPDFSTPTEITATTLRACLEEADATEFTTLGFLAKGYLKVSYQPLRTKGRGSEQIYRIFLEDQGAIAAAFSEPSFRLPLVQFQTEFTDGSFLLSMNAGSGVDPLDPEDTRVPGTRMVYRPISASISELLQAHRDAIAETCRDRAGVDVVRLKSSDDVLASERRQKSLSIERAEKLGQPFTAEIMFVEAPAESAWRTEVLEQMEIFLWQEKARPVGSSHSLTEPAAVADKPKV